jgi:hypothetical protein
MNDHPHQITRRALLLGSLFTLLFAILTVYFGNRHAIYISSVQIPVLPYVLLLLTVLILNPIARLIRIIRPFTVAETLVIFTMGLVSAGISTFGLTDQLLPVMGSLFNRHWNNDQTEWNRYVEPFLNDAYFVAIPGIQKAAAAYQAVRAEADQLQVLHDAAVQVLQARTAVEHRQAQLAALEATPTTAARDLELAALRTDLNQATETLRRARNNWFSLSRPATMPESPEAALPLLAERLAAKRAEADTRRAELAALEKTAFEKVDLFRRGLPPHLRAFPGFLPIPGIDDFVGYTARLRRLLAGRRALAEIRQAMDLLRASQDRTRLDADRQNAVSTALARARLALTPVADETPFERRRLELDSELDTLARERAHLEAELSRLSEERRGAVGEEIRRLDRQVPVFGRRLDALRKTAEKRAVIREQSLRNLDIARTIQSLLRSLEEVERRLPDQAPSELFADLQTLRHVFPGIDATLTRYLLGDVPWTDWLFPLLRWIVLVLVTYAMLLAFNVLIFRQWAYNEKLIYPLNELPELLAGAQDSTPGWIPEIFRNGLFWVGFAVPALVLGWNILCKTGWVQNLTPFDLTNSWKDYITNTPFQALLPSAKSAIFFTMIGLTFLIPAKVSFSLWFFSVLYMVQLMILVGLGYGVNEQSFPEEWWYTFSFRTAEGAGALMVFASVVLWKCRRYLFCAIRPAATVGLDADERQELRLASAIFLASFVGIVLLLWLSMGTSFWLALFSLFVILVITIGLVRAVTEGGLLGFQAWTSPFHFIRTFLGMNRPATSPSLLAPLMVYYAVLFLDIKTFIAPAMANSLKLRDDLRLSRLRFHGLMILAILLAMGISIATALMLAYSKGADNMSGWFYTHFPKGLYDKIASMAKTPPLPTQAEAGWVIAGAAAMALLLYLRQSLFWLPHPIGLIMLVNPIMRYYWFSILLGWLAKSLVTRYGGKTTYARARGLFIGLIAGEVIMVALAMIFSLALDTSIPIDLNRN